MRVKGHVGGVWSRRANLFCGSRRLAAECGLGGRICRAGQRTCRRSVVKKGVGGVWSRRANLSSGSRKPAVECGLGGRICRAGQEGCRRSVV